MGKFTSPENIRILMDLRDRGKISGNIIFHALSQRMNNGEMQNFKETPEGKDLLGNRGIERKDLLSLYQENVHSLIPENPRGRTDLQALREMEDSLLWHKQIPELYFLPLGTGVDSSSLRNRSKYQPNPDFLVMRAGESLAWENWRRKGKSPPIPEDVTLSDVKNYGDKKRINPMQPHFSQNPGYKNILQGGEIAAYEEGTLKAFEFALQGDNRKGKITKEDYFLISKMLAELRENPRDPSLQYEIWDFCQRKYGFHPPLLRDSSKLDIRKHLSSRGRREMDLAERILGSFSPKEEKKVSPILRAEALKGGEMVTGSQGKFSGRGGNLPQDDSFSDS